MADVRALLRNERLARRITHPNAVYSSAGTLSCTVCNLRLQADSLWEPHLAGKTHRKNLQLLQATPSAAPATEVSAPAPETTTISTATNGGGRKRKADDEDLVSQANGKKRKAIDSEDEDDTRRYEAPEKRQKHNGAASSNGNLDLTTNPNVSVENKMEDEDGSANIETIEEPVSMNPPDATAPGVDDDEYAAFEAAIAANAEEDESIQQPAVSAIRASADIAAAPITAAELASREAEELNQQRKGRDAEIEDEKEDAARALEEEFDEMDQLEARVRKLREMRERLREAQQEEDSVEGGEADTEPPAPQDEIDEDTDDEYDDDDWGFR